MIERFLRASSILPVVKYIFLDVNLLSGFNDLIILVFLVPNLRKCSSKIARILASTKAK